MVFVWNVSKAIEYDAIRNSINNAKVHVHYNTYPSHNYVCFVFVFKILFIVFLMFDMFFGDTFSLFLISLQFH